MNGESDTPAGAQAVFSYAVLKSEIWGCISVFLVGADFSRIFQLFYADFLVSGSSLHKSFVRGWVASHPPNNPLFASTRQTSLSAFVLLGHPCPRSEGEDFGGGVLMAVVC